MKTDPYFSPRIEISCKWIQQYSIGTDTLNPTEENRNLCLNPLPHETTNNLYQQTSVQGTPLFKWRGSSEKEKNLYQLHILQRVSL